MGAVINPFTGKIDITGSGGIPVGTALLLDQTTPQTVINGAPIFNGGISAPGSGSTSERFGAGALAGGIGAVALGKSASASGGAGIAIGLSSSVAAYASDGIAIGKGASVAASRGIAIGYLSSVGASVYGIAIGDQTSTGVYTAVAFGQGAIASADHQFIVGSPSNYYNDVYFGQGYSVGNVPAIQDTTIHATGRSNTDNAGGNLILAGGRGTGAGTPGNVVIKVSTAAGSSNIPQTLSTIGTFSPTGLGIGTTTPGTRLHVEAPSGTFAQGIRTSFGTNGWTMVTGTDNALYYGYGAVGAEAVMLTIPSTGKVGIGVAPTAVLHLKAGTATAGTAPLKFTAGALNTTAELGALEFVDDGTNGHLYITRNVSGVLTRTLIV